MADALAEQVATIHRALIPVADLDVRRGTATDRHRAVMSLFPASLPGNVGLVRATSNILYRFETSPAAGNVVLVQSDIALADAHRWPTREVPLTALTAPVGVAVMFRLAAYTIRRNRKEERPIALDDVPAWVESKLAGALTDVTVFDVNRDVLTGPHPGSKMQIDTIDGVATVADDAALAKLTHQGVGRGKAYGAGLLTIAIAAN